MTLPIFSTWRPDGSLCLLIEPEISPVRLEDLEKSVAATTALFTRQLESAIRRYPEQWNWLGFPRSSQNSSIGRSKGNASGHPSRPSRRSELRIADPTKKRILYPAEIRIELLDLALSGLVLITSNRSPDSKCRAFSVSSR